MLILNDVNIDFKRRQHVICEKLIVELVPSACNRHMHMFAYVNYQSIYWDVQTSRIVHSTDCTLVTCRDNYLEWNSAGRSEMLRATVEVICSQKMSEDHNFAGQASSRASQQAISDISGSSRHNLFVGCWQSHRCFLIQSLEILKVMRFIAPFPLGLLQKWSTPFQDQLHFEMNAKRE